MKFGIAEIVSLFVVLVGLGTIVAAAAQVSDALAILAAGLFLVLLGVIGVYVAAVMEKAASRPKAGDRP